MTKREERVKLQERWHRAVMYEGSKRQKEKVEREREREREGELLGVWDWEREIDESEGSVSKI